MKTHIMQFTLIYFWIIVTLMPTSLESSIIGNTFFFLDIQFGGGRVIRPGEVLETADDKAAKEARTRQLLAAYKTKIGLNIDPKLKSECDQV